MLIKFKVSLEMDEGKQMCDNTLVQSTKQALINCILHIFIKKSHLKSPFHSLKLDSGIGGGRVVSTTFLKLPKYWVIYIEDNVY